MTAAYVVDMCRICEEMQRLPIEQVELNLGSNVIIWTCPACGVLEIRLVGPAAVDVLAVEGATLTYG